MHRVLEQTPVLSRFDGSKVGTNQLDPELRQRAVLGKRHGRVESRLPTHGRQQRVGPFLLDDAGD